MPSSYGWGVLGYSKLKSAKLCLNFWGGGFLAIQNSKCQVMPKFPGRGGGILATQNSKCSDQIFIFRGEEGRREGGELCQNEQNFAILWKPLHRR